MINLKM